MIVHSHLPPWVAPGAPVVVQGWTSRSADVQALVDGRPAADARSGRFGKFVVRFRAPGPGRHQVSVRSSGERVAAGRLFVRPLALAAVGDVTPGENVAPAISAHGGAYPWASVGPVLRSADLATANLEGVVTSRGIAAVKQYTFRGPVALLTGAARYGGIDVLTLANNHSLDFGPVGLFDSLAAARLAGIATVGAGANAAAARRAAFFDVGGLRVAFLGYSDVNPPGFAAGPSSAGTARADVTAISEDVRAAKRRADLVVVWFHWGVELHAQPNADQRTYGEAALRAGAAVVLGAHPHVLGPVERRPHQLVAWTLGNFVFPAGAGASLRTAILRVQLDANGVRGYELVPARAGVQPTLAGR